MLRFRRKRIDAVNPLYPIFRKRITDAVDRIIQRQVTPWAFLTAGPAFRVQRFDQSEITYQGIEFDGSPRLVFWGHYIEPFLEHLCSSEIAAAVEMCRSREVEAPRVLVDVRGLLAAGLQRVYEQMALIDQRLRGRGFPNRVQPRSVDSQKRRMTQFLDELIGAERALWRSKSRTELWYERNKFWVWVVGILITVSLSATSIIARFL